MSMSMRERIISVYNGEVPDVVPYMLDLSHWFYHKHKIPWDLSMDYDKPDKELIGYHKKMGVGFYMPNLASFYSVKYRDDVSVDVKKEEINDEKAITWVYSTPYGSIRRSRIWHESTYSWHIRDWGVKTEKDLRILGYIMSSRVFIPNWDNYRAWVDCVGDDGVVYMPFEYSAMGYLLSYWMGPEATTYAIYDWNDTVQEVVDQINRNSMDFVRMLSESPAEIIVMGDNFSSDLQPPKFFNKWSRSFYEQAINCIHGAGKYAAVHIDGKLKGSLGMIRDVGADCADAVTPAPMGDLTPDQCRQEAGVDFILSGGLSPDLWLPSVDIKYFEEAVINWLELKKYGSRFIANAGDQVPPDAEEERIIIMRDLVESYGRY